MSGDSDAKAEASCLSSLSVVEEEEESTTTGLNPQNSRAAFHTRHVTRANRETSPMIGKRHVWLTKLEEEDDSAPTTSAIPRRRVRGRRSYVDHQTGQDTPHRIA